MKKFHVAKECRVDLSFGGIELTITYLCGTKEKVAGERKKVLTKGLCKTCERIAK